MYPKIIFLIFVFQLLARNTHALFELNGDQKLCRLRNCSIVIDKRERTTSIFPQNSQISKCTPKNPNEFCLGPVGLFEFVSSGIEQNKRNSNEIEQYELRENLIQTDNQNSDYQIQNSNLNLNQSFVYVEDQISDKNFSKEPAKISQNSDFINSTKQEIDKQQQQQQINNCPSVWDPVCCYGMHFGQILNQKNPVRQTFSNICEAENDLKIWLTCSKGPCLNLENSNSNSNITSDSSNIDDQQQQQQQQQQYDNYYNDNQYQNSVDGFVEVARVGFVNGNTNININNLQNILSVKNDNEEKTDEYIQQIQQQYGDNDIYNQQLSTNQPSYNNNNDSQQQVTTDYQYNNNNNVENNNSQTTDENIYSAFTIQSSDDCDDIAPDDNWTCEEQKQFEKCNEDWMLNGDFCRKTCEKCTQNQQQQQQQQQYQQSQQSQQQQSQQQYQSSQQNYKNNQYHLNVEQQYKQRRLLQQGGGQPVCSVEAMQLPTCCEEYIVQPGEDIQYISQKFDISINDLLVINGLKSGDNVMQYDKLQIC